MKDVYYDRNKDTLRSPNDCTERMTQLQAVQDTRSAKRQQAARTHFTLNRNTITFIVRIVWKKAIQDSTGIGYLVAKIARSTYSK